MLRHNQIKGYFLVFVIIFINVNVSPTSGLIVYTAHVKWDGYNMSNTENCGDGIGNSCEDSLRIERTSSSSCSGLSWDYGTYKTVYTYTVSYPGFYELTWVSTTSPPCLNFNARFYENSAGYATQEYSYTIKSDGSNSFAYLWLNIGSADGYFKITYWLTVEDLPYQ